MSVPKKLWYMLIPEQRRAACVLLGFMLIGMVLETLGIGLVIPAVALMTDSELVKKYPVLAPLLSRFGNPSQEWLVVVGMLMLVGVYAVKVVFLAFLSWRQACFVFGLQEKLSQRLFEGYLRQPYTFHLQRNSAQLIRNAMGQVANLTNVIQNGLVLMAESLVLLGICVLLLMVEPIGALVVVSVLGLAGWSFYRLTRRRMLSWGEAFQYHEGLRIQHLQQGMGGAKDIKLFGRESEFLVQYGVHNIGSARASQHQAILYALPRLGLELLAVAGLAALVLIMIIQGKSVGTMLPTLGLFAAAAFRLMPSVNRMLGAIQGVRFYLPAIETLYGELCLFNGTVNASHGYPLSLRFALTLDEVNFYYPSADIPALRGINLSIPRGASVGFIGGSGAGKSTLVDIILGLLAPSSGTVKIDGLDIQTNLRSWQDQIGYVPQSIYLTDDTLRCNVAFGLSVGRIDEDAVWRAINAAQLGEFVNGLPQGLDTVVGERGIRLSGGQRQRIGIARALYHNPQVLVLDEATSALDTATERGVMDAVRALQGNKTIIIIAHRLSTVEFCDRLFRLEQGRIVEEGAATEILSKDVNYVK